jgi:hypothetical protein
MGKAFNFSVFMKAIQKVGLDRMGRSEVDMIGGQRGSSDIRGRADMIGCSRDWGIWPK